MEVLHAEMTKHPGSAALSLAGTLIAFFEEYGKDYDRYVKAVHRAGDIASALGKDGQEFGVVVPSGLGDLLNKVLNIRDADVYDSREDFEKENGKVEGPISDPHNILAMERTRNG